MTDNPAIQIGNVHAQDSPQHEKHGVDDKQPEFLNTHQASKQPKKPGGDKQ